MLEKLKPVKDYRNFLENYFEKNTENNIQAILYYAPWCEFSQKVLPIWAEFQTYADTYFENVQVTKIDCTIENYPNIQAYPTIIFSKNGIESEYYGNRNLESFIEYTVTLNSYNL